MSIPISELIKRDKEIERLNNELELQNIEKGREIEKLHSIIKKATNETKKQLKRAVSQEYTDLDKILKILEEK